MKLQRLMAAAALLTGVGVLGAHQVGFASDHDDGEIDLKSRALNLTDHFAFKSPQNANNLVLTMYVNPRSLPQRQYTLSPNARYELHVTKIADKLSAATGAEDFIFRFEAGEPDANGVQMITLTQITNGTASTPVTGMSTSFSSSAAGTVTTNDGPNGSKFFVGMRADAFHFDVIRFFQIRNYLATRFFGGAGGLGNAGAELAPNCKGQAFLGGQTALGGTPENDGDEFNLWNPPECAPDFTKNYNVTAIVLEIPISALGGSVFDTWSTVSVKQ
jgi:hypothetical protein